MWKHLFNLSEKPIPSFIWYLMSIAIMIHLPEQTNLFLSNKVTRSAFYFLGLRMDYCMYIFGIGMSIILGSRTIYRHFKKNKLLRTTCFIHCIGIFAEFTIAGINIFTQIRV